MPPVQLTYHGEPALLYRRIEGWLVRHSGGCQVDGLSQMSGSVEFIPPWCNWQHSGFWCHLSGFESWRGSLDGPGPDRTSQGPLSFPPTKPPGILRMSTPPTPQPKGTPVSANRPAAVVVLAAGEGTRMKSATPKVLHEICGRSLVGHVARRRPRAGPREPGRRRRATPASRSPRISPRSTPTSAPPSRREQNGTGHAVRMGAGGAAAAAVDGTVVVVCGDTPLLTGETLAHARRDPLRRRQRRDRADRRGAGRHRLRPDRAGRGVRARSPRSSSTRTRPTRSARSGRSTPGSSPSTGSCSRTRWARCGRTTARARSTSPTSSGSCARPGTGSGASVAADHREIAGINNRVQLAEARRMLNDRLLTRAMLGGRDA